ncbi:hypothetical protein [Virgibacillus sp. SK37]|nr:hypothetical protein [Virgibacillus sp. SK37]AIF45624.1 hypothetical protein X953_18240 [Virgibacillus sp. SK37]
MDLNKEVESATMEELKNYQSDCIFIEVNFAEKEGLTSSVEKVFNH